MARPTFDLLTAIFESHPRARHAEQLSGITAAQAAADVVHRMAQAPNQAARDSILRTALAAADVHTTGEAAFHQGTEQMLERMSNRDTADREAQRMAQESSQYGRPVSVERIKYMHRVASQASLQQGLSDRLRAADARLDRHAPPPAPASQDVQAYRAGESDRRAAVRAAVAGSHGGRQMLRLTGDVSAAVQAQAEAEGRSTHGNASRANLEGPRGLRETLTAAFDAHVERDAELDPLEDPSLRAMSNAV